MLGDIATLRAYIGNSSDLVVVVPRGVGSTFPAMTCDANDFAGTQRALEEQNNLPGYFNRSLLESYTIGVDLGIDCGVATPDVIPYVGTVSTAHDMDSVRHALGQKQLSYLGFSYGTVLGGTYAYLFPDKVGRMVLDGVLEFNDYYQADKDPEFDIADADLALNTFFQACHASGSTKACAIWSQSLADIEAKFYKADQLLFNDPLPVPGLGLLNWPLWRSGVYTALYRPSEGFPLVAGAITEVLSGAAGPYIEAYLTLALSGDVAGASNPIDPSSGLRNSLDAGDIISCSDSGGSATTLTEQQLEAKFSRYQQVSEYFGGISVNYVLVCLGARLSAKPKFTGKFEHVSTANPILFVSNTADPTTPIRGARRMNAAFVGSGLLTINGTGHISKNAEQGTHCATQWIAPYFKTGKLPPNGTVCDGKQRFFQ